MILLSWSTFRDRWQLFVGAMITVCLGVALVQASLLTLIAAATPDLPPGLSEVDRAALRDGYAGALSLLSMILGLAAFVAIFIVSSTFAFTVAQRRRDLALLRLTGAGRGQVRRLLVGEALLLGALGTAGGVLVGVPVMRFEAWLLARLSFVPAGFTVPWRDWVVAVSAGTGVGIAVLGVLAASRRAGRILPLEALRETGAGARVMTGSRWVVGLVFLAGAIAMIITASGVGGAGALALSLLTCLVLVIACTALAPLLVPLVALVLARPLGQLAYANLRAGVRRSAATATPITVLVGLVLGLGGSLGAITAAGRAESTRSHRADLVVSATRPVAAELAAVDGVGTVAEQIPVQVSVDSGAGFDPQSALAVEPASYLATHRLDVREGDLAGLRGQTIAATVGYGPYQRVGDPVRVRIGGVQQTLRLVAVLPETLRGPQFLLPRELVPAGPAPRQYLIQVTGGEAATRVDAVAGRIAAAGLGEVTTVDAMISQEVAGQERTNRNVLVALLGLAMLYTVIAIINAVVVAAADRGTEFAVARLTGLSRAQVVQVTLRESLAVVAVGVVLGGLCATGSLLGVGAALSDLTGVRVLHVPWRLATPLVIGTAAVVGVTSVLTTLAGTRQPPIRLAGARE